MLWRALPLFLGAQFGPVHAPGPGAPGLNSCADRNADWTLPCRPPSDGWRLRFGAGSDFPIAAWCGPLGYLSATNDPAELRAYAAANFSQVMVSDRMGARCDEGDPAKGWRASWHFLQAEITEAAELGLQSLIDTYRCLPWGGETNLGGAFQSSPWQAPYQPFVSRGSNHKITLPELRCKMPQYRCHLGCIVLKTAAILSLTGHGDDSHGHSHGGVGDIAVRRTVSLLASGLHSSKSASNDRAGRR